MNAALAAVEESWDGWNIAMLIGGILAFWVLLLVFACWRVRGPQDTALIALFRLLNLAYTRLFHGLRPVAEDPLPASGPAILIANHRSGIDPIVLSVHTRRLVRFLMAREYYEIFWLRPFFNLVGAIPVNRDGNDVAATKKALKALKDGHVIGIFPEGGIRLENAVAPPVAGGSNGGPDNEQNSGPNGGLNGTAGEFIKAGAALLALKTGVPVIPAFIEGAPSRDSILQSFFIPSRTRVNFGKPIHLAAPASRSPSKEELRGATQEIFRRLKDLEGKAGVTP